MMIHQGPRRSLTDFEVKNVIRADCSASVLVEFFHVYCDWQSLQLLSASQLEASAVVAAAYRVGMVVV